MPIEVLIPGLHILFIGVSVVFSALTIVALAITLFGYIDQKIQSRIFVKENELIEDKAPERANPQFVAFTESPATETIQPEVMAAISAAVALSFRKKVRITRIHKVAPDPTWHRQGRIALMLSHRVR